MLEFRAFGTVYRDAESARADIRARACELTVYTPIHTIYCDSEEEIADKFMAQYGDELAQLGCSVFLYAEIEGTWRRIPMDP